MKKWLVVVTDEQYGWIKKTAEETGVKGSTVIREVLDRARTIESGDFKMSLLKSQIKNQLEEREIEKRRIEQEIQALHAKLRGGKVTA